MWTEQAFDVTLTLPVTDNKSLTCEQILSFASA